VKMRPVDIDVSGSVWKYTPPHHKTAHHGHKRTIYIGPKGQEIIGRYLAGRPVDAYVFSPAEAEQQRRAPALCVSSSPASARQWIRGGALSKHLLPDHLRQLLR
jgi:hypothetical protein